MMRATLDDDMPAPVLDKGPFLNDSWVVSRPFFSTGCLIADLILAGGLAEGQMINLIGDSSTGKSLMAWEWTAEFLAKFANSVCIMHDIEDAHDVGYFKSIGIPVDRIEMVEKREGYPGYIASTVEAIGDHLMATAVRSKNQKKHILYVIDSWDAVTDEAELGADMSDSKSWATKAKKGGEMARKLWAKLPGCNLTVLIVSQVRDNVDGGKFQPQFRRNGGKWLDFYCSQVFWMFKSTKIENTRKKVKKTYGRWTRMVPSKNRRCGEGATIYLPIIFNQGVCDLMAMVRWLSDCGRAEDLFDGDEDGDEDETVDKNGKKKKASPKAQATKYVNAVWRLSQERYYEEVAEVSPVIRKVFKEVRDAFMPKVRKKRGQQQ